MTSAPATSAEKRVDRKYQLDRLRVTAPEAMKKLDELQDIEITYTSNAIEGNSLGPRQTTRVIKGGTIKGKRGKQHHLEVLDHWDALRYARDVLAQETAPVTESDIGNLHRLCMQRSRPDIAGRYADGRRYLRTGSGRQEFPSPAEIPALMHDFCRWLSTTQATPDTAFTAHRRLVEIHPFNDGNGRVARLLMNLLLVRSGYPPVAVRLEDRDEYLSALEQAQVGKGTETFDALLNARLDETMSEYIHAFKAPAPRQ